MNKRSASLCLVAALVAPPLLGACKPSPSANTVMAPAASASLPNVSDIDVTEHVKTALQLNDSLKGFDISVVTLKGDVRLIGVLDNQAQIDEALKIARASEGVHTLHDELTLKK